MNHDPEISLYVHSTKLMKREYVYNSKEGDRGRIMTKTMCYVGNEKSVDR